MDKCPKCGSENRGWPGKPWHYKCGSHSYTANVFYQSDECACRVELIHYKGSLEAAEKRVAELEAHIAQHYTKAATAYIKELEAELESKPELVRRLAAASHLYDDLQKHYRGAIDRESEIIKRAEKAESDLAAARAEIERKDKALSFYAAAAVNGIVRCQPMRIIEENGEIARSALAPSAPSEVKPEETLEEQLADMDSDAIDWDHQG